MKKLVVETMYKEFERIQKKSAATDDWFFRYVSTAIIPFFVFVAFCSVKSDFQVFLLALPFLSCLGVMVVVILTTHYLWAAAYNTYLEERVNLLIGSEELVNEKFSIAFYKKWDSPVTLANIVGFAALLIVNGVAVMLINRQLQIFNARPEFRHYELVKIYWTANLLFVGATIAGIAFTMLRTARRGVALVSQLRSAHVENASAAETINAS